MRIPTTTKCCDTLTELLNISTINFLRSNMPDPVEVQFLPSGKKVKAYLGQNIGMIAKAANVEIKYSCKKGKDSALTESTTK